MPFCCFISPPVRTRFEEVDNLVEDDDQHDGDEGKVPADDKHDGHTHGCPQQRHPAVVQLEGRPPACKQHTHRQGCIKKTMYIHTLYRYSFCTSHYSIVDTKRILLYQCTVVQWNLR